MAKTRHDTLLGRITREKKENALIMTISDLSEELQQDIKDTVPPETTSQGLKATHNFLLAFMPSQYRKHFKWPE